MHRLNIFKGHDLKALPRNQLVSNFGKVGNYFYDVVRGIDNRPVVSYRESKSIGAERTYDTDLYELEQVEGRLDEVLELMWKRCEVKKKSGKTLTLKLRFSDFTTITRSRTQQHPFNYREMKSALMELVPVERVREQGVRLLGATMSNFEVEKKQPTQQIEIDFGPAVFKKGRENI